ncbi:MAG: pantetheine-phosphate adenylyltransferase [Synechococcus sp.]
MIALYPGSFDPVTFGHLDIIARAARLFDRLIVAVLKSPTKQPLFTIEQRLQQIATATQQWSNVDVSTFAGLTVTHARQQNAAVLIRGLRAVSDFEFELQMAHTNKTLEPELETIFLSCSTEHSFLSSSVVKEIARHGGPIEHLVPNNVRLDLQSAFQQQR